MGARTLLLSPTAPADWDGALGFPPDAARGGADAVPSGTPGTGSVSGETQAQKAASAPDSPSYSCPSNLSLYFISSSSQRFQAPCALPLFPRGAEGYVDMRPFLVL